MGAAMDSGATEAQLIDGKAIAAALRAEVAADAAAFRREHGRPPGLHVVLVGDDPASAVYVRSKERAAAEAGLAGAVHRLPASASEAAVLGLVRELNGADEVDGVLVQFPVPQGIRQSAVVEALGAEKDVDGLHALNVGRLWSGEPGLVPCTPRGCVHLLEAANVPLRGRRAVVLGRSNLVGKPIAALLLARDCTVTLAHSRTAELAERTREADIVIAAVGRAGLVRGEWLKPGAAVIDVGINRGPDGKLAGDVDFESARRVAGWLTPVPGGVGPMTIAMLLDNTVRAARARIEHSAVS
jgi:methylenetetrahydrofolate dehydrogenase (NADP+)/methenyltetrahydrofolate cyclohydrolase